MPDPQPTSHDKPPEMPLGLHLLSDTTSEAGQGGVTVDIVAVHGLGAHPDHAWVRHKNTTTGPEEDVRWLTDLLPQTLREYNVGIRARIFCFNYQSAWLGPHLTKNRLEGLAVRLLDDIHNAREKNGTVGDRPLIFIGHSFGGLVIEQAIVQANSAEGRYEYLVKLVGGIVLLGTPHQGSKSQKWGSIMANLAHLINYGESGLMKECDEKSMKISDLTSEFKKIMISMDLAKTAIVCFYENSPTSYLSRFLNPGPRIQGQTSSIVVEETSAVLSGFHSIVLDSDHLKLNKFASAQDGNYVSVSSNLCRIAAEAPQIFRRRQKAEETVSSHFIVSRERVKDFIGREKMLDEIRLHFSAGQIEHQQILILHALGGQGKSQIALEYCRKWRETYRGVFWINANSETTVTQSYGMIAAELPGGSQIDTRDSIALVKFVKGHLEQWSEAWLLVFDNYDDPESFPEVKRFIPPKGHGHILLTSRNQDLSRLGTLLEIPPMAPKEAVRLLLRGYSDDEIQEQQQDTASKIVERLGHLALAIDQAAAYIKYKRIPLDRLESFLTTYETERRRILTYKPDKFWEYKINAFTTWEMSFQQLGSGDEQWKKHVAHFLTLSAFFAPTSITESLFRHYRESHGAEVKWMQIFSLPDGVGDDENDDEGDDEGDDEDNDKEDEMVGKSSSGGDFHAMWDTNQFWDVIAKSNELSLLQSISHGTDQGGARFSLHPLIRDWLQLRSKPRERRNYTQETIEVLACCAEAYVNRLTTLEEKTALMTHMDVSRSNDEEFLKPQDRLGRTVTSCITATSFAFFYNERGQYSTSDELLRRVVETKKSILGEKDPSTLGSMHNLASILGVQKKYEEAEQMYRSMLKLEGTILGQKHPSTLESKRDWTSVPELRDSLKGAEGSLRPISTLEEPELVNLDSGALDSLATILSLQCKYEEGERLCRQTLLLRESVFGKEDPRTLRSMGLLAEFLRYQGKTEEAEQTCRQTLMLRESVLGKEHPDTFDSMGGLVFILGVSNKYEEAERISRQILSLRERQLGKDHPDLSRSLESLCFILVRQGKHEEVERIYRELLISRERQQGKEYPDTLGNLQSLCCVLMNQGKHEEAERIYRELLISRERQQGKEHPDTLDSLECLCCTLGNQGKYEEAERIYRELLISRERQQGKEHPDTLRSLEGLCFVLKNKGKYEEAECICRQIVDLREAMLGKQHPDTLSKLQHLMLILFGQDKYEEAERICRQMLDSREAMLGKQHPNTLRSLEYLEQILRIQGKHEEADQIAAGKAS